MHPEEAVRQIEHAVNATQDDAGSRVAATYRHTFEEVAEQGSEEDVYSLATELSSEVCENGCHTPAEVNQAAERILDAYSDQAR